MLLILFVTLFGQDANDQTKAVVVTKAAPNIEMEVLSRSQRKTKKKLAGQVEQTTEKQTTV